MGITNLSLARINRYLQPGNKILIIGCQNLYSADNYDQVAAPYFRELGYEVKDIDLTGCQGSETADLREDLHFADIYDVVTDN